MYHFTEEVTLHAYHIVKCAIAGSRGYTIATSSYICKCIAIFQKNKGKNDNRYVCVPREAILLMSGGGGGREGDRSGGLVVGL